MEANPMTSLLRALILLASMPAFIVAGQTPDPAGALAQPQSSADPVLVQRPPPRPGTSVGFFPEGRIKLDVLVTDAAGNPATGLEPLDFKLMDNGKTSKILSFRIFDGVHARPDPPVEAILVIDTANLPFQQVAFVRQEVERFLRRNGGHLAQPVSIMLVSDAGLRVQPRPSTDGNALAGVVEQIKGSIRTIDASMGGQGLVERFQLSAHQLETIAENEAQKPGRKLLIWVGPGWPMLNHSELGYYSPRDRQRYFDAIVELSTKLREARMVVYSVSPANLGAGGSDSTYTLLYQNYLKAVQSASQAEAGDLALKVLVTQTGGRIIGPDNDLAAQIDRCMADANSFYRISFNPPPAMHADEYHGLQVEIDKPGLTARTNTGYYDQPEDAGRADAGGVKVQ
jgi:VWFA-related protein